MGFVIREDFRYLITLADLDRLTNATDSVWQEAEISAIEEASSYIRHRYDTDTGFRETRLHDAANPYNEGDRVYTLTGGEPTFYVASQDVPATTVITDDTFWTVGDDRNRKLLTSIIIIILFENYTRLNGSEIPNWLQIRYDGNDARQNGGVIGYLKSAQKGTIEIDFPLRPEVADGTAVNGNRIINGVADDVKCKNQSI